MDVRTFEAVVEVSVPVDLPLRLYEERKIAGAVTVWRPGVERLVGPLMFLRRERALYVTRPELGESVFSSFRNPAHEPDAWYPEPHELTFCGWSLTPAGARELLAVATGDKLDEFLAVLRAHGFPENEEGRPEATLDDAQGGD